MSTTSDATKGAVSGAMPWLILVGGVLAVVWWLRSRGAVDVSQAIREKIETDTGLNVGFTEKELTSPMFGACSTGFNWLINKNGCRSASASSDVGILAPSTGGTPFADLVNRLFPPHQHLNEPPAPVENYVSGSAADAFANAESIRAAAAAALAAHAPLGLISSYNQVRQYDVNRYQIPAGYQGEMVQADFLNPATGEYLDLSPYGWVVYKQDYSTLNPTGWANKRGSTAFGGLTHELGAWL